MKTIPCPAHPNGRVHWYSLSKHQAVLFENGEQFAGIWECLRTGESDSCEHDPEFWRVEEFSGYWPTQEQIDRGTDHDEEWQQYVCGVCGEPIDLDRADPAADAYDAMVDAEIDFARGK